MRKHSFFNMYFTSAISISLVLFLMGMLISIILTTNQLTKQVKENVGLSVILKDDVDSIEVQRLMALMEVAPFVKSVQYISKEEALQEHIISLGEDPAEFLGYNPLLASLEVKLKADYAVSDSIRLIENKLQPFQGIKRIFYHKDLIDLVEQNISVVSWAFFIIVLILLVISIVLINNTIRLSIYSKRFLINTMKLVGATSWMIKRPFVRKNVWVGLIASFIAIVLLGGTSYYLWYRTGITLVPNIFELQLFLVGSIIVCGFLISFVAAYFAVGRYIRMKANDLYYI